MPQVFYRKYRPQKFSEFVGQEHVVKTLTNAISMEMISHAYLFSGPKGTGKTTLARIFAKAVNCQNRKKGEFEPCCQCTSCAEIQQGKSMDLIEIDAASHRGIDEIRELREAVKFSPAKSKYKIYIIDEAHQITKDAANALLKTLEEPPAHAIFILVTTEPLKMIPTILSRCQKFQFKKLQVDQILKKLKQIVEKEEIEIESKALKLIALSSDGSLRDAETLLEKIVTVFGKKGIDAEKVKEILGTIDIKIVSEFSEFLIQKDLKNAISLLNKFVEEGIDLEEFLKSLIYYWHLCLTAKIFGNEKNPYFEEISKEEAERLENQSKKIPEKTIREILNILLETRNKMRFSPIPQLPLELASVEIVEILKKI
jgi:DNA polymerase-3 subunit gamma/tau